MCNESGCGIEYGLCHCGCGEETSRARRSRGGYEKGEPKRFLPGHNRRVNRMRGEDHPNFSGGVHRTVHGYLTQVVHGHPHADARGRVPHHRIVVEETIGRILPETAVIHHVNGIKGDNRPENLVVCETRSYHQLLHRRKTALDACGHPGWMKCRYCGSWDDPEKMYVKPAGNAAWHRRCRRDGPPAVKLTPAEVGEIRRRHIYGGETLASLGDEFGVSMSNVGLIVRGKSWKNAPGPTRGPMQ